VHYRLPVGSFRRSGWRSRSLKRFTTAGKGVDSPRSYRENALCPPPVSSAALAWLRRSFLRIRRISDRCAARACSTSVSPAAVYRFALLRSNSISAQSEQRRPDRPLTSADKPIWEIRNVSPLNALLIASDFKITEHRRSPHHPIARNLFRVVTFLVNQLNLAENLLRLFQAVLPLTVRLLVLSKSRLSRYITGISLDCPLQSHCLARRPTGAPAKAKLTARVRSRADAKPQGPKPQTAKMS